MKVVTIVGTRPEIIRLSRVLSVLEETVEHVLVHTGQNYDYHLYQTFFEDLDLKPPAHYLDIDTSTLGRVLGETLIETEKVLVAERPDAVLLLGDTNASVAAIIAKRMHIPVYHMEAGNRSFDENVPEETNRRLVDHVADFNLAYNEHARRNLLAEGLHPRRVMVSGSPMREIIDHYGAKARESRVLEKSGLTPSGYFLASLHREENVDSPSRLTALLDALEAVFAEYRLPVIFSTHPRTRKRLGKLTRSVSAGIRYMEPFNFTDYLWLQQNAACVLSDSGTIAEESALLKFPAVTLRSAIERPEALDAGTLIMSTVHPADLLRAIEFSRLSMTRPRPALPSGYEIDDTSRRVTNFILSTAPIHHQWSGLPSPRR